MEASKESVDFISTVFTRKKNSGIFRFILNLKYLNDFVVYKYFKIESILDVFKIIKKDVWMASVEPNDVLFTIPINETYQKHFTFEWSGNIYEFTAIPNVFQMQYVFLQKDLNKYIHI